MKRIPVHKLRDRTDQNFLIFPFTQKDMTHRQSDLLGAHRDDHYIFFVVLEGSGTTVVDFEERTVGSSQLYYILPDQIHYRIKTTQATGWFIAVDAALIDPICRATFESWLGFHEPVSLAPSDLQQLDALLRILHAKTRDDRSGAAVRYALLRSFFEMAAESMRGAEEPGVDSSRPAELARKFKKLLHERIRQYKSPSEYARMLHISEPYLNECLKKVTGSSVSFWIKYRLVLEAKQLLYFSDLNVKEIAGELGFESHNYFSRFFAKETGMTALSFRRGQEGRRKLI